MTAVEKSTIEHARRSTRGLFSCSIQRPILPAIQRFRQEKCHIDGTPLRDVDGLVIYPNVIRNRVPYLYAKDDRITYATVAAGIETIADEVNLAYTERSRHVPS